MDKKHYLNDYDFVSSLPQKTYNVKVDRKNRSVSFTAPYANATIRCFATFKKNGKLNRVEVEIEDVYKKYGSKETMLDWVKGVISKVSFIWIKKGTICFEFSPKADDIVIESFPSDCLSLVDLFVEQMNDYTGMHVADPFLVEFQFEHSMKLLKGSKITFLVCLFVLAVFTVLFTVASIINFSNGSTGASVFCIILLILGLIGCVFSVTKFIAAKKDFEKVHSLEIKYKSRK